MRKYVGERIKALREAQEMTLDAAVARALRTLDPSITVGWVQEVAALHDEAVVLRARDATLRTRPDDVRAYFAAQFKRIVPPEAPRPRNPRNIRVPRGGNPYGDDEPPEEPPF